MIGQAFGQFQYPTPPLAVHPAETIEAHRAFIARRRRPAHPLSGSGTPRRGGKPFLAHFEKRKVPIGTCARVFGSPWAQLAEIRDNLIARIAEAETEGWLGEVEGLQVSLAGAEEKLSQLDRGHRQHAAVDLGIPATRGDR